MSCIFFFATLREAAITIKTFGAVEGGEGDGRFSFPGGEIIISGMGMAQALASALQAPSKECRWVNLGIAGCFDTSVSIGTGVPIGRTALLQCRSEEIIVLDEALPATLYTSPVPVYATPNVFEKLALVDMEGHVFARVAREKRVQLSMVKVVSDFCTDTSHATICENIDALSYRLAEEAAQYSMPGVNP
jgi:nucleoside phosphorylase